MQSNLVAQQPSWETWLLQPSRQLCGAEMRCLVFCCVVLGWVDARDQTQQATRGRSEGGNQPSRSNQINEAAERKAAA